MKLAYNSNIAVFVAIVLFPFAVLAWRVVNAVWIKPKKLEKKLRDQGFNGNPYSFYVGDLIKISTLVKEAQSKPSDISDNVASRVIPQVLHHIQKYGDKSFLWLGTSPALLIHDFEQVKEAHRDVNLFHKLTNTDFNRFVTAGLLSHNGSKWQKHRKILTPAFGLEKLKNMLPSFKISANEMLKKWDDIVSPLGWCELDVSPSLSAMTCDAISRTAFGSNYEEGRRIFELQEEQADLCLKTLWSDFIPGWRYLPTAANRRKSEIEKDVNSSIRQIIMTRMKAEQPSNNGLLGQILESNSREMDLGMSIEEVIQECKLLYFAGQETTSVLLVWTMILLSRYEEWQIRAREEVMQVFGSNQPDFDGIKRLKVVNMIISESLRLYPPLPVYGRKLTAETQLGDATVPAGVIFLFETLLVHSDPAIWGDDANEFNPDRFSQGLSNATKGQHAYFPFGAGPRTCIGQNFSLLQAKCVLAMILQRFSFQLSPSYVHAPGSIVILKPQHGAHLILRTL